MEEAIIKKLKTLLALRPNPEYVSRSVSLILTSEQRTKRFGLIAMSLREMVTLGTAIALAALLIVVLVGGLSFGNGKMASNLPGLFDITLDQVKYFDEKDRAEVAFRLGELKTQIRSDRDLETQVRDDLLRQVEDLERVLIK